MTIVQWGICDENRMGGYIRQINTVGTTVRGNINSRDRAVSGSSNSSDYRGKLTAPRREHSCFIAIIGELEAGHVLVDQGQGRLAVGMRPERVWPGHKVTFWRQVPHGISHGNPGFAHVVAKEK